MPVKRRIDKSRSHRITPEAIEAFIETDMWALHRALGLAPWEMSPLLDTEHSMGTPAERPLRPSKSFEHSYDQAVELRAALLAAAKALL